MKNKQIVCLIIGLLLFNIICLNFFVLANRPDIFTKAKKQLFSLNQGDNYSGRLNLWRLLFQNNYLAKSAKIE